VLPAALAVLALGSCATRQLTLEPSTGHVTADRAVVKAPGDILPPVTSSAFAVPPPKPAVKPQTYSVVVNDVPVRELLLALARDTRQNIDIHPGLTGLVSINAINETLPAILDRISKQVSMRYQQEGGVIIVQPDTPYLKTYRVNYVNMTRDSESRIGVSGQISDVSQIGGGSSGSGSGGGGAGATGNQSQTTVRTQSKNDFWEILRENIRSILASTRAQSLNAQDRAVRAEAMRTAREERLAQAEAVARAGAGATALFKEAFSGAVPAIPGDARDDIVVNPVAGTVSVIATERQHQLIQQHIDGVVTAVHRQVLIEATIVEVQLTDKYQGGVDWSRLAIRGGIEFTQRLLSGFGAGLTQSGNDFMQVAYTNPNSSWGNISATVKLLEEFGNTRVLSSPKLMALNNQTALLKVVDNIVYFEVTSQANTTQGVSTQTVNTTAKTVSVGVVMGVTAQINDDGRVTLTVRPTVSRVLSFVEDPNPTLVFAGQRISNRVPQVQVREMESVLQVSNGQTVVLGGLMQDDVKRNRQQLPGVDAINPIGELFRFRDEAALKTELIIFLKPTVATNASLDSDELKFFQRFLPRAPEAPAPKP